MGGFGSGSRIFLKLTHRRKKSPRFQTLDFLNLSVHSAGLLCNTGAGAGAGFATMYRLQMVTGYRVLCTGYGGG
ncbi:MAG: hypothetical protein QGG48_07985, partial [Desulfatiglandales bacterium]|nr:hypothetical protein [Desulfatiglandales bacterium]